MFSSVKANRRGAQIAKKNKKSIFQAKMPYEFVHKIPAKQVELFISLNLKLSNLANQLMHTPLANMITSQAESITINLQIKQKVGKIINAFVSRKIFRNFRRLEKFEPNHLFHPP